MNWGTYFWSTPATVSRGGLFSAQTVWLVILTSANIENGNDAQSAQLTSLGTRCRNAK
jgi:hypothetical protein